MVDPSDLRVVICSRKSGFARTLCMALSGTGVRGAQIVGDPLAAIRAISGFEAHALIVHVDAPEDDIGVSLIRFVRRWENSPDIRLPIVAATDRRDFATVSAIINAGANEFVGFPVAGDVVRKRIIAAMNSQRPFVESRNYVGPCRRRRDSPSYTGPERRLGAPEPAVEPAPEAEAAAS